MYFSQRIKRVGKKFAYHCLPIQWLHHGSGAAILLYHDVGPPTDFTRKLRITLPASRFVRHIEYLKANYNILPFSKFVKRLEDPSALAITFDDGYQSVKETVLPVIERYQISIKVFLSGEVLSGSIGWLNKLSYLLCNLELKQRSNLAYEAANYLGDPKEIDIPLFWREFINGKTNRVIDRYFEKNRPSEIPNLFLTEDDICSLLEHPLIEWGSHSESHYPLDKLDDFQMHRSVVGFHNKLNRKFNNRIHGFALPFGEKKHLNRKIGKVVSEIDSFFLMACGGLVDRQSTDNSHELKRIQAVSSLRQLAYHLNATHNPIMVARYLTHEYDYNNHQTV